MSSSLSSCPLYCATHFSSFVSRTSTIWHQLIPLALLLLGHSRGLWDAILCHPKSLDFLACCLSAALLMLHCSLLLAWTSWLHVVLSPLFCLYDCYCRSLLYYLSPSRLVLFLNHSSHSSATTCTVNCVLDYLVLWSLLSNSLLWLHGYVLFYTQIPQQQSLYPQIHTLAWHGRIIVMILLSCCSIMVTLTTERNLYFM